MKQWLAMSLVVPALLAGCGGDTSQPTADSETSADTASAEGGDTGTLVLVANGEDFIRQGFVTKDGWRIDFENVYVTLDEVAAYQSDPAFDPDQDSEIQAKEQVNLVEEPTTVDLAAGDADADPIQVTETQAPAGTYNATSWQIVTAPSGEAEGHSIVMVGTAQKDDRTIDFVINLDRELAYTCGEYVGDQRKGFLESADNAEIETTFHFDHIFGDGEAPADDEINTGAVGFEPFANLAEDDTLNVDRSTLEAQMSPQDYQTLEEAIAGLGHVGEGHCQEQPLES